VINEKQPLEIDKVFEELKRNLLELTKQIDKEEAEFFRFGY